LYQTIDEHWNIFKNDTEIRILKDYSMMSQKFTKYYSSEYITFLKTSIIPLIECNIIKNNLVKIKY